jgi:hypothetical protein
MRFFPPAWGEKISAVEGIKLTAKKRAAEFDGLGLSPPQRRQAIMRANRKA